MGLEDYRIVKMVGNTHIGEDINAAMHSGFLWVHAVPQVEIAGFKSTPNPEYLVFADRLFTPEEAGTAFQAWIESQGS